MIRAARAAEIHDFVMTLPGGYDAAVGERGVNLSEGQKQRLSLARALVKDPDILILDEPTSALDGATESSIVHALPFLLRGKTLLIVAHRLSAIRGVDRIFRLEGNRIWEDGSREFLHQPAGYSTVMTAGTFHPSEDPFPARGGIRGAVL